VADLPEVEDNLVWPETADPAADPAIVVVEIAAVVLEAEDNSVQLETVEPAGPATVAAAAGLGLEAEGRLVVQ
jgi:hypothetical protein